MCDASQRRGGKGLVLMPPLFVKATIIQAPSLLLMARKGVSCWFEIRHIKLRISVLQPLSGISRSRVPASLAPWLLRASISNKPMKRCFGKIASCPRRGPSRKQPQCLSFLARHPHPSFLLELQIVGGHLGASGAGVGWAGGEEKRSV